MHGDDDNEQGGQQQQPTETTHTESTTQKPAQPAGGEHAEMVPDHTD